jgi:dihydroorotase
MSQSLTIPRPDDWHLHFRDGEMLRAVVPHTARDFARAIVMPNLVPPVRTGADAAAYAERIRAAIPDGADFTPLMTLYLTETTDPDDVEAAYAAGIITALKLYPAGATTNSDAGVRDFAKAHGVFERMEALGIPLLTHGEVTAAEVDIFDREARFIEDVLDPLRRRFPRLRVVMEHITTRDGADYVASATPGLVGATITVQHLMLNRNHMLVGGVRPHYYCLPILKRSTHQDALLAAATSGDPRYFLGTDSAPHPTDLKENACGCAGVFSAPNALACLAQTFEDADALPQFEAFVSRNGAAFYGKAVNAATLRLERTDDPQPVPEPIIVGAQTVTVFDPIRPIHWRVAR